MSVAAAEGGHVQDANERGGGLFVSIGKSSETSRGEFGEKNLSYASITNYKYKIL